LDSILIETVTNNMKLSIIIVSWNAREDLVNCLRSIGKKQPCDEYEIIVIDNASMDGTAETVRNNFPEVTLIVNDENRGFAAANNQGIRRSQGQYILLLNPDTIVHSESLNILVNFLDDNKNVGICGPKLLNNDGTTQPSTRRYPTFRGVIHRHTVFRSIRIFRGQYQKWLMKDFGHDKQMDVDEVTGAALMVRRSVIEEVGDMDEAFFMYYEEVDLCFRANQVNWRIVFIPDAKITHLGGRSAEQIPVSNRIMMLTSLLTFFRKHRGKFNTGLFNCVFKPAVILKNACDWLTNIIAYILAKMTILQKRKRTTYAVKLRNSAELLWKHSWRILFKI